MLRLTRTFARHCHEAIGMASKEKFESGEHHAKRNTF